ncbi:NmrA/HSCARG family protein [Arthrobacter echini]|uniref:NmrA/HSCARG family protein n=1 Tax=Arthrobacter echini TaxID=1529066 RepID=A0A4S5E662_9MICC|nr:NmrA/HSCARG family protein [Arthrobacter echini]THJ67017.1 NmrA/HSCARG family protein [Arthrobacter echini]
MSSADAPVLVLGATGGQGGAVAAALIARGTTVRALVRTPGSASARALARRGVDVVAGSLDDTASLTRAMRGVRSAFAVTTPFESGTHAEVAQGRAIIAAAGKATVPHLVFSSVAGAQQDSGVPHFESKAVIEAELIASAVPSTILGPAYFFDNALGGEEQIRDGVLELPLPDDRPLHQLARADLGRFAATVLLDPQPFTGTRIELASDAPTPHLMAEALTAASGHPVRHERTPLSASGNADMRAMWEFLLDPGYRIDLAQLRATYPDMHWTSFAQWSDEAFVS